MYFRSQQKAPSEAAIIYVATSQDQLPADAAVQQAFSQLKDNTFNAFFAADGGLRYCLRLGDKSGYEKSLDAARLLSHKNWKFWPQSLLVESCLPDANDTRLPAIFEGLALGRYRVGSWKKEGLSPLPALDSYLNNNGTSGASTASADPIFGATQQSSSTIEKTIEERLVLADVEMRIMDLVNAPANYKRPQDLAAWAEASARTYNYQAKVLDKTACEEAGLHALLAVNRGSEDDARFIILEYKGKNATAGAPTALVGKGVTFDTGGLSIKGATNMHLMKSDMGGAAAVFGTMEAAARLELPLNLVGIIPATDNSVDALSIKPSDVIQSYSGKTIEIIDTDAEGRLILADGLAYAQQQYAPAQLISLATLTGSAVRTFGYYCAALFSKDEKLVEGLQTAGHQAGQRCWPLPTWDDYAVSLNSDVADILNYSGKPINGAIDAFKFLEFFTDDHPHYAHLDIAGVALKAGPYAKDRMATAYGPRLLLDWLMA